MPVALLFQRPLLHFRLRLLAQALLTGTQLILLQVHCLITGAFREPAGAAAALPTLLI